MLNRLYRPILNQSFTPPTFLPRPGELGAVPLVSTDLASAELIKYAANAFLALKISYINEIGQLADKVGADITQVARGIGLDARIGSRFLQPGVGWGGSCFGKDTAALIATAAEYDHDMPIVPAAREVNQRQRQVVVDKLLDELRILKGRKIGLLGLAFKPNTDDLRDSPAHRHRPAADRPRRPGHAARPGRRRPVPGRAAGPGAAPGRARRRGLRRQRRRRAGHRVAAVPGPGLGQVRRPDAHPGRARRPALPGPGPPGEARLPVPDHHKLSSDRLVPFSRFRAIRRFIVILAAWESDAGGAGGVRAAGPGGGAPAAAGPGDADRGERARGAAAARPRAAEPARGGGRDHRRRPRPGDRRDRWRAHLRDGAVLLRLVLGRQRRRPARQRHHGRLRRAGDRVGDRPARNKFVLGITAGRAHTCALALEAESFGAYCWGANDEGQLGDGSPDRQTRPKEVATDVIGIAAGAEHTCALTTEFTVSCWGRNDEGQLGVDTAGAASSSPEEVPGLTGIVHVAAGEDSTCAVDGDGKAYCWGAITSAAAPAPVAKNGFAQVGVGRSHACGLVGSTLTGGDVYCWGADGRDSSATATARSTRPCRCGWPAPGSTSRSARPATRPAR